MSFPPDPITEMFINGAWVDISADVRLDPPIEITRGRANETSQVAPTSVSLTVNNRDGRYSPRNPNSPYFGLIGRNTPLRVRLPDQTVDTFTRTTSNGWGTSDSGQAWSVYSTASEFATSGSAGTITFNATNSSRFTYLAGSRADVDVTASFSTNELATGAPQRAGLTARYRDFGEHYLLWLTLNTNQTVGLELWVLIAGTPTVLATATTALTHAVNTAIKVRFSVNGTALKGKAWLASGTEPSAWDIEQADTQLGTAGMIGCRVRTDTGNLNGSMVFSVDNITATDVRCVAEVSQWPPRWDVSGRDVYVPLEASGIFRRLQQGNSPLRSQLRRGLEAQNSVVYWPMEDGEGATSFAAAAAGGSGLVFNSLISPANSSVVGLGGSQPLAVIETGGTLRAPVPMGTTTGWTVQLVANIAYTGSTDADLLRWKTPGGTPAWWRIQLRAGSPPGISIYGLDADRVALPAFDGLVTFTAAADGSSAVGRWLVLTVTAAQNGANIDYSIEWNFSEDAEGTQGLSWSDAGTLARITAVDTGPYLSHVNGTAIGHILITADDSDGLYGRDDSEFLGAKSETAGNRISRLCAEEGVPCLIIGDPDLTAAVGPQGVSTLMTLLQDAADADGGILGEMRGEVGVTYRTYRSLLNQHLAPTVELDYDAGHIAPTIEPTEDDQLLRNDVTVSRRDGSSARKVVTTGPLNTAAPPDGVGVYDAAETLNVYSDDQLPDAAGWLAHRGTWDEHRIPQVRIDMAAPAVIADEALVAALGAADVGDCITIDNPPAWMPPDRIELLGQGYRETLGHKDRQLAWNTVPAGPYYAFVVEHSTLGRVDTSGSTLASGCTSTATSLSVAFSVTGDHWSTTAPDFDIAIGGERVTVTAVTGTSSPQTFTVVRSVNGVVKAHAAGTDIRLWRPGALAVT